MNLFRGSEPATTPPSAAAETDRTIEILIRARYPIIYVVTFEEARVLAALEQIARTRNKRMYLWSLTQGLTAGGTSTPGGEGTRNLVAALDQVLHSRESALYVFRDAHAQLEQADIVRKLKDVAMAIKASFNTVIIISPVLRVPVELEKEITVVDYPLPGYRELDGILQGVIDSVKSNPNVHIDLPAPAREKIVRAALGLTQTEAENAFARALVMDGRLGPEDIDVILSEKKQIIRKTGILEYFPAQAQFRDVGGLDLLKDWLHKRAAAFSEKARQFGLPQPRGLLLLGVQGCGKSLSAKAISGFWNLPLLRLDVGRVFSSMMGQSEDNIRRAIMMAESISPCLLWIDELEKGMAGMRSSGDTDGGTSARVMSTFLTWMQEKTRPVFVIATANDVSQLPPEMLRKGRFDEIFFVDLPGLAERREILEIHVTRRGRDPKRFNLDALAVATAEFSGAELEEGIVDALYDVFEMGRDVTTEDIVRAMKGIVPLSRSMAEPLQRLREWAVTRARPASSGAEPVKVRGGA